MINNTSIITSEFVENCNKPRISGMHIAVYDLLSYIGSGMTHEQILQELPSLTEDDIFGLPELCSRCSHIPFG